MNDASASSMLQGGGAGMAGAASQLAGMVGQMTGGGSGIMNVSTQGWHVLLERAMTARFKCLCCNYWTLSENPPGSFEICPVCYWEDDFAQGTNINLSGGANDLSLSQAQENFRKLQVSDPKVAIKVRPPEPDELINPQEPS